MKFINSIREGDFVKLKTLEQLETEFGKPQEGGAIGSVFFGDRNNLASSFFVYENVKEELGNVLHIKKDKLFEITLDIDGEQTMILAFDFKNVKFDVDHYINPEWGLWNGEIAHIMEIVNEKINS